MFEGICDILGLHAFVLVYIQHIHALTYIYIRVYIYYMQCTFTFIHIYYTLIIIQAHTPTPMLKILYTCNYSSTLHIQHAPSCINKCAHLYNIWFPFVFFNNYYYLLTCTAHVLTYPHLYYLVSVFMFIFYHLVCLHQTHITIPTSLLHTAYICIYFICFYLHQTQATVAIFVLQVLLHLYLLLFIYIYIYIIYTIHTHANVPAYVPPSSAFRPLLRLFLGVLTSLFGSRVQRPFLGSR